MAQRETTLPDRESMAKRLRMKTKLTKATQEGLLPFLQRHASGPMDGKTVVNSIALAIAGYVITVPSLTTQVVWDRAGEIIDAFVDDVEVKKDAHAFLRELNDRTNG